MFTLSNIVIAGSFHTIWNGKGIKIRIPTGWRVWGFSFFARSLCTHHPKHKELPPWPLPISQSRSKFSLSFAALEKSLPLLQKSLPCKTLELGEGTTATCQQIFLESQMEQNGKHFVLPNSQIKMLLLSSLIFFPFTGREKTAFAIKRVYFHGKFFHLQYLHIMFKYLPQEDIPLNNASVYLLQKSRIAGSPLWESFSKFN